MNESRIETAKGMCVVDVTKFLMQRNGCTHDAAFAHLMEMELYQLLMDTDSGMYLEPNDYLFECCEVEESYGTDGLYNFIRVE
jgi:hypothetical protein